MKDTAAFEAREFEERIARVQARMRGEGLDLLLVSSPENINYLSGYQGWSFYVPQLLALRVDAARPVLVLREMDRACARYTSSLSDDDVAGYEESWVGDPGRHAMRRIGEIVTDRGLSGGVVGVELDADYLSPRGFQELTSALPHERIADASLLVDRERIVKSPRELDHLRAAATIADAAMERAGLTLRPGVRACDAAAAIVGQLIAGTPDHGGDIPTVVFLMPGERAAAPHVTWTDDPLPAGVPVSIELGGCRFRYHAGLARTFFLGSPPGELARLASTVVDGMDAAIGAVRPGARCEDVEAAWRRVLTAAGYDKSSRIGYSIGLGFQPSWVERTASLQRGDRTVLVPDMTFHLICGMWEGSHNVELSETIRVAEDGVEVLTSFPRELIAIDG
jgi:Xaa-Pro dipeptidase